MPHAFSSTDFVRAPHRGWSTDAAQLLRPCSTPEACLWKSNQLSRRKHSRCLRPVISAAPEQSNNEPSAQASRSVSDYPPGYKIRCLKLEEAEQVAQLNSEAFAWVESEKMQPGLLKQYTEDAEKFYRQSIYHDSQQQLKKSLHEKQQAARSSREATLRQQSRKIRADIARLQGQPVPALPLESRLEKVALRSWRKKRQFMCLAVEDRSSGLIVASCILSLAAPDALLPAPFPTSKPWRLYCSNMAVNPAHRRKRLATALLHKCQQIGALWGHRDMWLHVDIINDPAQKLYQGSGFGIKSQDPWYYIVGRKRYLMRKDLPIKQQIGGAAGDASSVAQGSVRSSDGVYIWDVQSKPKPSISDPQQSVSSDVDSQ